MSEDAFQFRPEEYLAIMQRVIKRLDAHAVAGQDQATPRLLPDRNREHAAEAGKAGIAPM